MKNQTQFIELNLSDLSKAEQKRIIAEGNADLQRLSSSRSQECQGWLPERINQIKSRLWAR